MIARLHIEDKDAVECSFETFVPSGRVALTIGDVELYASPGAMRAMARSILEACDRLDGAEKPEKAAA